MTVRLVAMVNYCSKSLAKDSANIGGYGCATINLNFLDWPGWLESPDKTSCLHLVNWHNAGIFLLRGGALHFLPENKRSQMGLASESSIQIAKRVGFLYGAPNAHIVMLTSWLSCISCREGIYRNFAQHRVIALNDCKVKWCQTFAKKTKLAAHHMPITKILPWSQMTNTKWHCSGALLC